MKSCEKFHPQRLAQRIEEEEKTAVVPTHENNRFRSQNTFIFLLATNLSHYFVIVTNIHYKKRFQQRDI